MLLRVSGQINGTDVDVSAVTGANASSNVEHGDALIAFAETVIGSDAAALAAARAALVDRIGPAATSDAAAIIASFCTNVRVADACGIELDDRGAEFRTAMASELGIEHFAAER